ncbi:DUF4231 domain-containing protein [Pseudokineococcus basanitobsidens]|uniref:DUF4231 domain-containing protein n=1 Tax=Pseudokineococcus basanitobsidens TaxID=1926649 RepID=A0ABU8RF37_9ACTN
MASDALRPGRGLMSSPPGAEDYLRDRVEQYRHWYDARARFCKRCYLRVRVTGLLAGSTTVLMCGLWDDRLRYATAAGALVTLLALTLDGVLRLREQWENYRYTEQYLDREKHLFLASAGIYREVDARVALQRFVERVEWAIGAENSTTLATLALAPDIRTDTR